MEVSLNLVQKILEPVLQYGYVANDIDVEIANAIAAYVQANPEWIKCSERMPEGETQVLIATEHGEIAIAKRWNGRWSISCLPHDENLCKITHWMPLPAAPKGD